MKRNLSSKSKSVWAIIPAIIALVIVAPTISSASLLATGERDSESYRLGYAIASIMTLKSQEKTVYFDVIPSNDGDDGLKLLQDEVSDFALVTSSAAASAFDRGDGAKLMRGLIVVRRPQDRFLVLLTRADVAEQDVIDVTRAIFDHLDILVQLHESAAGIEAYVKLDDHPFSIHPGAASYFADADRKPAALTAKTPTPDDSDDTSETSSALSDLSEELNLIKMERNALVGELGSARLRQTSMMDKLESVEQQLETAVGERERFSDELAAAKARLNTIEFQKLSEANDAAREMRLRAEQSEERYRKAVGVAQICVEAQTGRRDNAFETLAQIEQLEAEVAACRAAQKR